MLYIYLDIKFNSVKSDLPLPRECTDPSTVFPGPPPNVENDTWLTVQQDTQTTSFELGSERKHKFMIDHAVPLTILKVYLANRKNRMQAIGGCNADPDSFDVDGDMLAYGCGPCVIIQSLSTYETLCYVPLNFGVVTCVKFTTASELIIGTCEGYLFIFSIATKQVQSLLTFESSITHLAIYENEVLISTALNGLVYLKLDGDALVVIKHFHEELRCTALSVVTFLDEVIFAYGIPDGSVEVLVPSTGSTVTMDGSAWTRSIKFCIDETGENVLLATGSQEKLIKVWRITSGETSAISKLASTVTSQAVLSIQTMDLHVELLGVMIGHSDWVNCIDFCGAKALCSASYDGQVLIWSSEELGDYDINIRLGTTAVGDDQSGFFGCKLLAPNDVIAVSRNGGFSRWIDGKTVRCFAGHSDIVTSVCYTPLGCLMSVGLDNVGRVYQKDGGIYRESARPLIHGHGIYDVGVIRDDLYAFAGDEKCVRLLQPTLCFAKNLPSTILSSYNLGFAAMVLPLALDNKIIKTAEDVESEFKPLVPSDFMKDRIPDAHEMWLTRWPEINSLWGHERELRRMAISSGDWLATGDDRGGFVVWDKVKLERRGKYNPEATKAPTTGIAAAPDATMLILVLENGLIKMIDPTRDEPFVMKEIDGEPGLQACAWATNSEYFAVGGMSGLYIFERDGSQTMTWSDSAVTAIEYISEYDMLIGLKSGEVQRMTYNASERTLTFVKKYQNHGGQVNTIKYNKEINEIVTCGDDHVIIVENL